MLRIGIREQLAAVVLVTALVPLAVLAIATWVNTQAWVSKVTSSSLSLTASLKAAQVSTDLLLIQSTCATLVSRAILQDSIISFYADNGATPNWTEASNDIWGVLGSGGLSTLLQVTVFSRNETGNPYGILNVTASSPNITLPFEYPNGTHVMLGDNGLGYPAALYPNITYNSTSTPDPVDPSVNETLVFAFPDFPLNSTSMLLLGPLQINETYALISLTLPIIEDSKPSYVLGFMTVIAIATFLVDVVQSREGLTDTGIILIVGPDRPENLFTYADRPATTDYRSPLSVIDSAVVEFVFPPSPAPGQDDRHSVYNAELLNYGRANFTEAQYPAVADGFGRLDVGVNNASNLLSTYNENNVSVSLGYARIQTYLVDWLLIVEQSHSETWEPIYQLRKIVLACAFGAIGLVLIFVVPFAHYSVRPIRRLREATKKSIAPPGQTPNGSVRSDQMDDPGVASGGEAADEENVRSSRPKKGFVVRLKHLTTTGRRRSKAERDEDHRRRGFRIPAKVQDRKHLIHDELSDLTGIEPVQLMQMNANFRSYLQCHDR
jgi:osomolarity two-component system sensor histidine kinase SLN1